MSFKVRDKVIYKNHLHRMDKKYFKINQTYKITKSCERNPLIEGYLLDEIKLRVHNEQLAKMVKANKLSKKLYPNAKEKEGWLII